MKVLRFVLLAVGCATAVVLCLRWVHPGWTPRRLLPRSEPAAIATVPRLTPAAGARAAVLSRLSDAPAYAPYFDRVRTDFPTEYVSLVDRESALVANGGHIPNPDRMMTDAMRQLRQTRGVLAAQAEAGPLDNMFAAQAAMLDVLASDSAALCVDFLYGGSSPEFMAFAATHRADVERLAIANLEAIASGKSSHLERRQPDPDTFDGLAQQLKAQGFSDDEIAAVLDGKTFDPPLPEARLCDAGRAYLRALAALPEEDRLKIYALSATLLARS